MKQVVIYQTINKTFSSREIKALEGLKLKVSNPALIEEVVQVINTKFPGAWDLKTAQQVYPHATRIAYR